jgi:hypothetical protein
MLETSLVNRYLFEKFGHRGYRYLARRCARSDPRAFLQRHYNASPVKRMLFPLARLTYHSRVKNTYLSRADDIGL